MSPTKPYKMPKPLPRNFDDARFLFGSYEDMINMAIQHREDAQYAEFAPWIIPSKHPDTTSAFTVERDFRNTLLVGSPILYVQNDTPYYARLSSVGETSLGIQGAPMTVADELTSVFVGDPTMLVQVDLLIPGLYAVAATTTLLLSQAGRYYSWSGFRARLVAFRIRHATDDSTVQPKINILVDGARVSTNDTTLGIQPSAAAWVWNPDVAIDKTNYIVETDDAIEVEVTAAGGTMDASDLSVALFFAMEKRAFSDILQLTNLHRLLYT